VRRAEGAFVAEGAKLLESALDAGAAIEAVFHAPPSELGAAAEALLERAREAGIRTHELMPGVIERVADAASPQPLLAVVAASTVPLRSVLSSSLLLVLVEVRDPGNLGAILRSADASGVDAVICTTGTGDLFNPKAARASAGSIFHLPLVCGVEVGELLAALSEAGIAAVATLAEGGEDYASVSLAPPLALLLGNESNGLPEELLDRLDGAISIPVEGGAESLNVAMAATVLCFELARRRRGATLPGHSMRP
jgi:TrmH family RNA methyltransferase